MAPGPVVSRAGGGDHGGGGLGSRRLPLCRPSPRPGHPLVGERHQRRTTRPCPRLPPRPGKSRGRTARRPSRSTARGVLPLRSARERSAPEPGRNRGKRGLRPVRTSHSVDRSSGSSPMGRPAAQWSPMATRAPTRVAHPGPLEPRHRALQPVVGPGRPPRPRPRVRRTSPSRRAATLPQRPPAGFRRSLGASARPPAAAAGKLTPAGRLRRGPRRSATIPALAALPLP